MLPLFAPVCSRGDNGPHPVNDCPFERLTDATAKQPAATAMTIPAPYDPNHPVRSLSRAATLHFVLDVKFQEVIAEWAGHTTDNSPKVEESAPWGVQEINP